MTISETTKRTVKIRSASPALIVAVQKGLSKLGPYDWFDCRDFAKKVAEKGGEKDLSYEISCYMSDLVNLNLVEYKWVWERGRRIHYRSVATPDLIDKAFSGKEEEVADAPPPKPKKKKKKKKRICCDAQELVKLKSGRLKCRNCGKKFGKKKKKEDEK